MYVYMITFIGHGSVPHFERSSHLRYLDTRVTAIPLFLAGLSSQNMWKGLPLTETISCLSHGI